MGIYCRDGHLLYRDGHQLQRWASTIEMGIYCRDGHRFRKLTKCLRTNKIIRKRLCRLEKKLAIDKRLGSVREIFTERTILLNEIFT